MHNDFSGPFRCLIVDDDRIMHVLLSALLSRENCWVESAGSGKEGIEKALSFRPDLIFMDIEMPEVNGIEATKRIRKALDLTRCPVIVAFTSVQTPEIRERCFEAGMDDFLAKPLTPEDLKVVLNHWKNAWRNSTAVLAS
jgi:CheY-like chemotaxis protein